MASQPPSPVEFPADTPIDDPIPSPVDPDPGAPADPTLPEIPAQVTAS
ncbi:hypothetical protein [Sphingomonas crocodyli]|nr:hypothetical protein [Sphingomonas crocodyli]